MLLALAPGSDHGLGPEDWDKSDRDALYFFPPVQGDFSGSAQVGESWIGPSLPSWAKTGPFTQVPGFSKIELCLSGDGQSSYLRVSAWHERSCTLMFTRKHF